MRARVLCVVGLCCGWLCASEAGCEGACVVCGWFVLWLVVWSEARQVVRVRVLFVLVVVVCERGRFVRVRVLFVLVCGWLCERGAGCEGVCVVSGWLCERGAGCEGACVVCVGCACVRASEAEVAKGAD